MLNTVLLVIAILMIPTTLIFINKINRSKKAKESITSCSHEFLSNLNNPPPLPKSKTFLIVATWDEHFKQYLATKSISSDSITDENLILIASSFTRNNANSFSCNVAYIIYDITNSSNVTVIKEDTIEM